MNIPDITIAVDGYSSTGKSTFARLIARRFGFLYLDSGALYRAVTLHAQETGLISDSGEISPGLEASLDRLEVHFGADGRTYIGERCVESDIRSMKVSSQVSPIAAVPYVRQWVDACLHRLASGGRVVMDGRDIGTAVFPDAELKIFMTASAEVRARRRYDEMKARGGDPDFAEVLANIQQRDYIDSHREASPLRRADDAFGLDNSEMTMEEELAWITGLIQGKFGIL